MTSNSTPIAGLPGSERPEPLIRPAGWVWIGLCTALFAWMHWTFIYSTYRFSKDPNWSHVLIVPAISIYYLYLHKDRFRAAPKRLCWWALPIVFFGLYAYLYGIYPGRNDMMRGYSMVLSIFGTALFLFGPAAMRVLWFPIVYLALAVKISDAIWSRIAEKLQDVASVGATWVLEGLAAVMSFTVERTGNTITMGFMDNGVWTYEPMNVAEACAGLRMLMAFIALGVALAFLFDRTWWQRLIMISLAVPIAVAVNVARVAALGVITTIDKDYAHGDFHLFVGMLMLIPAALLFLLVGWVLEKIVVRDDEDEAVGARVSPTTPTAGKGPKPSAATIVKGLLLGVGLALASGVAYGMAINAGAGKPLFAAVGPTLSLVLASLAAGGLVALLIVSVRLAPNARGPAALTFGAALICGVLGVASAGSHSVIAWQKLVLHKEAVPLRHILQANIPLDKGDYRFVEDQFLPPEVIDELGTEDYLSRTYEDLSVPRGEPGRLIRLHVAYYTGTVDTVPHVPDRCFVGGGAEHKGLSYRSLPLDPDVFAPRDDGDGYTARAKLDPPGQAGSYLGTDITVPDRDVEVSHFTFGPASRSDLDHHVMYFFAANGQFMASPNAVRFQGFDIRDEHSYYCKIEVMILGESDPDRAAERTAKLLDVFLPEIMACLPDWEQVRAGQWPPPAQP
jgi:exosortase